MNPKIQQISDVATTIEGKLNDISPELQASPQSGFMDARVLKDATRAILNDIKRLTKSSHLITYFTSAEVDTIYTALSQISGAIPSNTTQIVGSLNTLRPLVRSYWIRNRNQTETDQIQSCEEALIDLQEVISRKEQISNDSLSLKKELGEARDQLQELKAEISQLQNAKSKADQDVAQINTYKSKAESETATVEAKRATIDAFTEKIASREKTLKTLKPTPKLMLRPWLI